MPYRNEKLAFFNASFVNTSNMATPLTSENIDVRDCISYSIQANYIGSPVGSIQVEVTNDNPQLNPAAIWEPLPTTVKSINGAGSQFYDINECSYAWARIKYGAISGSGVLTGHYVTKVLI